jgi:hypothetical protein
MMHERYAPVLLLLLFLAGSVAGAMGLCSVFGMWSTLIIMEVVAFLVLAVGVDNMFVLAHALGRQVGASFECCYFCVTTAWCNMPD